MPSLEKAVGPFRAKYLRGLVTARPGCRDECHVPAWQGLSMTGGGRCPLDVLGTGGKGTLWTPLAGWAGGAATAELLVQPLGATSPSQRDALFITVMATGSPLPLGTW